MDWQTFFALLLVAIAGGALLRQAIRSLRGTGSTGCSGCGFRCQASGAKSLPLVSIKTRTS